MRLHFIYELFTNPLLKTKLVVKPPLRSLSFISYKSSGEFDPEAPDSPAQLSVELYRAGARCLNPPTLGPRLPSTNLSTTSTQKEKLHAGTISTREFLTCFVSLYENIMAIEVKASSKLTSDHTPDMEQNKLKPYSNIQ